MNQHQEPDHEYRAQREAARQALGRSGAPHAGLLLALGLANMKANKAEHLQCVAQLTAGDLYAGAYARRRLALEQYPHTLLQECSASERLSIGLGAESVLETGITLQHTYGTPYLPGSALKGLARRYAGQLAGVADDRARVLFGDTEAAAYIVYHDAWYVPGSSPGAQPGAAAADRPLVADIITVHHPQYYTAAAHRPPWDFDDPIPVPFLSAQGRYLVAISGPDGAWAEFALSLVLRALEQVGAGAKTSSGYGRLVPVGGKVGGAAAQPSGQHPLVEDLARTPPQNLKGAVGGVVDKWKKLPEAQKAQVAREIKAYLEVQLERKWLEKSAPWRTLRDYLVAHPE